jgi:uncharacterized protein (TIGR03435 family)
MRLIARCGTIRSFWLSAAFLVAFLLTAAKLAAQAPAPMPGWQKAAGGKLEFEVASVRPSKAQYADLSNSNLDLDLSDYFRYTGGPIRTTGSLLGYIAFAYKTDVTQDPKLSTELPRWALDESFTVEARSPVEKPTKDQIRLMMQSLLAERFGLRMHTEIKVQPVYALKLTAPDKPGLQRHPEDDKLCEDPNAKHPNAKGDPYPPGCGAIYFHLGENVYRLRIMDYTMAEIADGLAYPMGRFGLLDARPVLDQTGLTGHFDFSVEFTVPAKAGAEIGGEAAEPGATFIEALKRQAGLDVVKTIAPVTTYIVDAVQELTPN